MKLLELMPGEYRPKSTCATGIEELFAIGAAGAGEAAAAGTAATAAAAAAPAAAAGFSLPSLSTIGTIAGLGGTILQAKGQMDQAAYEQAVAKTQAQALRDKSNEDAAAAERQQIAIERRTGLITSRARALAADSGTDVNSPTEITNEGRIAQQGDYNALSSLYEGLAQSRADNYQANIDLFKGQRVAAAAPLAVGGTILSGLTTFADRRARLKYFTSSGGDNFFGGFGGFGGF